MRTLSLYSNNQLRMIYSGQKKKLRIIYMSKTGKNRIILQYACEKKILFVIHHARRIN